MEVRGAGALALLLGVAVPAAGQVTGGATPTPTPTAAATPLPIPATPVIVLPTATPSPVQPAGEAAAPPRPAATRSPAPRPSPSATARPLPTASPTPTPIASPSPAAAVPIVPAATPTAAPPPAAPATPAPLPPMAADDGTGRYWLAALLAGVVAAAALGWVLLRRRGGDPAAPVDEKTLAEQPVAPQATPAPRARLALAFRPRRAGINLLSATSENEVVVTNIGDAPAADIRVQLRLLSAHAAQDTDLAAVYAEPIGRPAVPAFALAPGEARTLSAVAALPRDAIRPLTAAGRPMFVPIVAVNILYASGTGEGQLAQAFAVGIERVDSSKLAPFWLDAPPRTYDQVAARPHAAALER